MKGERLTLSDMKCINLNKECIEILRIHYWYN